MPRTGSTRDDRPEALTLPPAALDGHAPLAARLRPRPLEEFVGPGPLVGDNGALRRLRRPRGALAGGPRPPRGHQRRRRASGAEHPRSGRGHVRGRGGGGGRRWAAVALPPDGSGGGGGPPRGRCPPRSRRSRRRRSSACWPTTARATATTTPSAPSSRASAATTPTRRSTGWAPWARAGGDPPFAAGPG